MPASRIDRLGIRSGALRPANDESEYEGVAMNEMGRWRAVPGHGVCMAECTIPVAVGTAAVDRGSNDAVAKGEFAARGTHPTAALIDDIAHELRPALDSMLTLARMLADNHGNTLTARQVDYAQTIYSTGTHLRSVVDALVDLAAAVDGAGDSAGPTRHRSEARVGETDDCNGIGAPAPTPLAAGRRGNGGAAPAAAMMALAPAYRGQKSRRPDDAVVLIADGDARAAATLLDLVRRNGYRGQLAIDLAALRSALADVQPVAILIGRSLRDCDGWSVVELLKCDPQSRHLPLVMMYASGGGHACVEIDAAAVPVAAAASVPQRTLAALRGASRHGLARVLLVDAVERRRVDAGADWRGHGIAVTVVGSGMRALELLRNGSWDGVAVGTEMEDMWLAELMQRLAAADWPTGLPVALPGLAGPDDAVPVAVFRYVAAPAAMLAETALFLHRHVDSRPSLPYAEPAGWCRQVPELEGRKALIVDDDVRGVYAMTGALEQQGMVVLHAENAADACAMLRAHPDTSIALVDAAVLDGDGEHLLATVHEMAAGRRLPVVAVGVGDGGERRGHGLSATVADSIERPVNIEQLLALVRVWLVEWQRSAH